MNKILSNEELQGLASIDSGQQKDPALRTLSTAAQGRLKFMNMHFKSPKNCPRASARTINKARLQRASLEQLSLWLYLRLCAKSTNLLTEYNFHFGILFIDLNKNIPKCHQQSTSPWSSMSFLMDALASQH